MDSQGFRDNNAQPRANSCPAHWMNGLATDTHLRSPPAQRSSRRQSNFRYAAIRRAVVQPSLGCNRARKVFQPLT
jgi:hypothetical protein